MTWLAVICNIISRVPIERVLFPPRDKTQALEQFAATMTAPVAQKEAPPEQKPPPTITQEPETVATACVPCAVGHFSTSAGLLKEAMRFKGEGITSNEVLDRIAMALEEQNTLERGDLTPEKLQSSPPWEREIAEEALLQSRQLRHNLESVRNIGQLEQLGADSERVYKKLFREWFRQRFARLGSEKAKMIADRVGKLSPEDKERVLKSPEGLVEEFSPGQDTMFFNVPEARQQLISKGFVYTLRPKMRRIGKDTAFYGSYYKKEKIGDIFVDLIKEVKDPEEVKQYVSDSGFKTLEDWWEAAKGSRFLFKVTLKEELTRPLL